MHDFLEFYDDDYTYAGCDEIIKFFDQTYTSKPAGLKAFNRNRQKICSTLTLNFGEDWKVNYSNQLSDIQVKISDWQDHFKEHLGK